MNDVEKRQARPGKETIHSGHFMVSHFEAEAQDDFDDLVSVPDEEQNPQKVSVVATYTVPSSVKPFTPNDKEECKHHQQLSIEVSLTKLFKCMTLAYRQKLTSPKWNRFKGIKLRWKDKIRLNNVIWRCWHMQFIKKQNTLVCQFASPLDVDTHVKPETTILEGKYWKRRAEAVKAEYKKWRKFHIMRLLGKGDTSAQDAISDMDTVESFSHCSDLASNMLTDEDYLNFMTDTLFSTITNHQPFAFPDCREIARGASLADFIQPSLGPLQPNLDDFMDTLEPLQDLLLAPRLPSVPEETTLSSEDPIYRSGMSVDSYTSQEFLTGSQTSSIVSLPASQMSIPGTNNNTQMMPVSDQRIKNEQLRMYDNGRLFTQADLQNNINSQDILPSFQPVVGYEQQNTSSSEPQQMHVNMYTTKSSRLQYVSAPKIITQSEPCYNKYNTGVPPSQTAPETVSLLQQPVQNPKYASTIVVQGRSGYSREKQRPRHGHYSNQIPNNQYQTYGPPMTQSGPLTPTGYDTRPGPVRQSPPQMQYLQQNPVETYKGKSAPNPSNVRSFKMPSPPAVATITQMNVVGKAVTSSNASISGSVVSRGKDQFRSHSLPIGSQLNADWSVSAPVSVHASAPAPALALATATAPAPALTPAPAVVAPHDTTVSKHAARGRESNPGAIRMRSRSSSSGVVSESAPSPPPRRPPPLNAVASEPTLPQASVMLAHLLSAQHSQSLYKLNANEDGNPGNEPTISPIRRGQPSPIGSEVMSPHHCASPPLSPGSPRAGSPRSPCSPRDSREPRRTHLHAEQKRRYNIKNGFDTLQALIPHLNANPGAKISKAAMLQKGAEYIKQLKAERNQIKDEMENLRQQIECLNNSISNCHSLLPATGAPVSRARAGRLREMFARHVANRTMHNWKYWLFSVVSAALVESFSACVSCGSGADLVRTTLLWAEQHCSLVEMRPAVLNSLRVLCTTTDILTNPERLPEEARAAIATSTAVKTEPT